MTDRAVTRAAVLRSLCDLEEHISIAMVRSGSVRRDRATYLPIVRAGSRSVLAQVTTDRRQALKCYLRPDPERLRRANEVAPALLDLASPDRLAVVDLELHPGALDVAGQAIDVAVMPWVEGTDLISWVAANGDQPTRVASVASSFAQVIDRLHRAGVVHGDLHHGSILVTDDDAVILVDLDASRLADRPAPVPGWAPHPEYGSTSPGAAGSDDRYAAWTIYASLAAIAIDGDLLRRLPGATTNRLLLGADDHADLGGGPVFSMLRAHPSPEIRAIAAVLRSIGATPAAELPLLDVEQIPTLDDPGRWVESASDELVQRRRELLDAYDAERRDLQAATDRRLATIWSRRSECADVAQADVSADELARHRLADELAGRVARPVLDELAEAGIETAADVTWDGGLADEVVRVPVNGGRKHIELIAADQRIIGLWRSGLRRAHRTNLDPAARRETLLALTNEETEILVGADDARAQARALMASKIGSVRPRMEGDGDDRLSAPPEPLTPRARPLPAAPS